MVDLFVYFVISFLLYFLDPFAVGGAPIPFADLFEIDLEQDMGRLQGRPKSGIFLLDEFHVFPYNMIDTWYSSTVCAYVAALLEQRGLPSGLFSTLGPRMHQILQRSLSGGTGRYTYRLGFRLTVQAELNTVFLLILNQRIFEYCYK